LHAAVITVEEASLSDCHATVNIRLLGSKLIVVREQPCMTMNSVQYLQIVPCSVKILAEMTVELQDKKSLREATAEKQVY
jgi:3-polyprenyl-4-hydroxybenzoate decarboxylase